MAHITGMAGLAVIAVSGIAATGASAASVTEQINEVFKAYTPETPGCAVGIKKDGKVVLKRGYGAANIETGEAITPDTIFYSASVSKQFTALSVNLLVEDGRIGLNDEIQDWIPEIPTYESPIRVHHLIHHTSGIKGHLSLLGYAGVEDYTKIDGPQTVRLLSAQKETLFPAGQQYKYSNGGYFLMSELVARASGKTFAGFAKDRIFGPLGMENTYFREPDSENNNRKRATAYDVRDGVVEKDDYLPATSGSGGLMTSVNDFLKYADDMAEGQHVWSAAIRTLMLTPGYLSGNEVFPPTASPRLNYAAGLGVYEHKGTDIIAHSGSFSGFRAYFVTIPSENFSTITLCNRADADLHEKIPEIVRIVTGISLDDDWRGISFGEQDPAPLRPAPEGFRAAFAGRYYAPELDAYYTFSETEKGFRLLVSSIYAPEEREFTDVADLKFTAEGDFAINPRYGLVARPAYGADGSITGFTLHNASLGRITFHRQ